MRASITIVAASVAAVTFLLPVAAAEPDARLVSDIHPGAGSDPRELTRAAGLVFFSANDGTHGRELWATDGTTSGTRLVRDIRPGDGGSSPTRLTRVGSHLFFSAADGSHGRELWVSDGTETGTRLVKDLTSGSKSTFISDIADASGTAYFTRGGRDLWRSDGTPAGTRLVREFLSVTVQGAQVLDSELVFSASGGGNARVWRTDGTAAGTKAISPSFWNISHLTRYRGRVYFAGAEPTEGCCGSVPRLWWSDGTKAGTQRLSAIFAPVDLTIMGGDLYFNAAPSADQRPRLYRGEGTAATTGPVVPRVRPLMGMVKEVGRLWDNAASVDPLYEPDEIWVSDGTATGTSLVYGSTQDWFSSGWDGLDCAGLDGRLWFAAGPGELVDAEQWTLSDHELWSSDGTREGTAKAADINPDGSSFPREFIKLGQAVLFTADDGSHGRELWSIVRI